MKFRISKSQLLDQLPEKAGYALQAAVKDGLPSMFVFDGAAVSEIEHEKIYPAEFNLLSPIEWQMFTELIKAGDAGASYAVLSTFCNFGSSKISCWTDNIRGHVMRIRRKLEPLGWAIKTHRAPFQSTGSGRFSMSRK